MYISIFFKGFHLFDAERESTSKGSRQRERRRRRLPLIGESSGVTSPRTLGSGPEPRADA